MVTWEKLSRALSDVVGLGGLVTCLGVVGGCDKRGGGIGGRPPDEEVVFSGMLRFVFRPPDLVKSTIIGFLRAGRGRSRGGA